MAQPNSPPVYTAIIDVKSRRNSDKKTADQSAHHLADAFTEAFAGDETAVGLTLTANGGWRVTVYFHSPRDERRVRELVALADGANTVRSVRFERVAARDWVAESLAGLKPVQAGRFVVHGAHDRAGIAQNRIEIEAALAFGTGHHGTTRGCLLALDRICKGLSGRRPIIRRHPEVRAKRASKGDGPGALAVVLRGSSRSLSSGRPLRAGPVGDEHLRMTGQRLRILDLGAGSGVLAIAAARALRQHVLATDIDAQAVRAARANARLNGVAAFIEAVRADGVARRAVLERAPFDLVFANILLGPLQRLAAPLIGLTAPSGRIILSGLLAAQANAAMAAYRPLALERRIDLDGWTTLVLARRTSVAP